MKNQRTEQSKKAITNALALCIFVPLIGVVSLIVALITSSVLTDTSYEAYSSKAAFIVGLTGIVILGLLTSFLFQSKNYLARAILPGLYIGCGIYLLIFSLGALSHIGILTANTASSPVCTTLRDQLIRAQSAVVPIQVETQDGTGTGTGFAVGDGSTILTAHHVIEGATSVKTNFVDDEQPLSLVNAAPDLDVAILKMDKPMTTFLNMSVQYRVADPIYTLGYPGNKFDAGQSSLSSGVLSRVLTNEDLKLNSAETPAGLELIQTDMAINPGNSGGPIFNRCGVIGVVSFKSDTQELTGISSEEGISFGISSKSIAERLKLPIN